MEFEAVSNHEEASVHYEIQDSPMPSSSSLSGLELRLPSKKRALYLFAGEKRHSSVRDYLAELGWHVEEIDILRSRSHDLTKRKFSDKLLERISQGRYSAVLGSPPCDTFSRVKFANRNGPRPVRTKDFIRGFPWLRGNQLTLVRLANTLTDFMWEAAKRQIKNVPGLLALEFPEDLGRVAHGEFAGFFPGSIWQHEQFHEILKFEGVTTLALHQADYGAEYLKPTRILMRGVPHSSGKFFVGKPVFDEAGTYVGPLPRRDAKSEGLRTLARTSSTEPFRTTGTAAWPAELCKWIATSLEDSLRVQPFYVQGETAANGLDSGDTAALSPHDFAIDVEPPITKEVPDHWIGGSGPPRKGYALGKFYDYHDGAGLTSPGRWDKDKRRFPQGQGWKNLRNRIFELLCNCELPSGEKLGSSGIQKLILQLACTPKTDVFRESWIQDLRGVIKEWLKGRCGDFQEHLPEVEPGQPFCLYYVHLLLREMRDADFEIFNEFRSGVTAGILNPLPRTPAIFEEQKKWRLTEDPLLEGIKEAENYGSLEEHLEVVEAQFKQEEKEGFMLEISDEELRKRYGTNFAISPLAVLVENPEKIRVIHDGTHKTRINHRIKCVDKLRAPGVREKHVQLRGNRDRGVIPISILADFSKAHRLVKIIPEEWGMLGCKLRSGTTWLNKVGTFGVGSAAYWWARLAGGLVRCTYGILNVDWPLEALLFADDLDFEAENEKERTAVVLALFLLIGLGAPMKYAKFRGGFRVQWIGLYFDNKTYSLGLSPSRAKWLIEWIEGKLKLGKIHVREMAGGLGRINFAASALFHERAWLGPIYSWTSAVLRADRAVVEIPWAVRLFLFWIAHRLKSGGELMSAPALPKEDGDWFRSDAKAEGGRAFIGSWETRGCRSTKESRWFYLELNKEEAPWVFSKEGDPGRVIASLELLGTLLSIIVFDIRSHTALRGGCSVTGLTDNLGNSHALIKGMSTKFPLAPLIIELSEQLRTRALDLRLTWVKRDLNTEADAITNQDFSLFDEKNRINISYSDIQWLVLDKVMEASKSIFEQVHEQRQRAREMKLTQRPEQGDVGKAGGKLKRKWSSSSFSNLKRTNPW